MMVTVVANRIHEHSAHAVPPPSVNAPIPATTSLNCHFRPGVWIAAHCKPAGFAGLDENNWLGSQSIFCRTNGKRIERAHPVLSMSRPSGSNEWPFSRGIVTWSLLRHFRYSFIVDRVETKRPPSFLDDGLNLLSVFRLHHPPRIESASTRPEVAVIRARSRRFAATGEYSQAGTINIHCGF